MSFTVALQSAVFYFMACTPCTSARQRTKARTRAKRERREKDRLEAEQPGMYHHPSPFNTSPHWDEEIMMGPSLPRKPYKNQSQSQRRLTVGSMSSGKDTPTTFASASTRSNSTIAMGTAPGSGLATGTVTTTTLAASTPATSAPAITLPPLSRPRLGSGGGGTADDGASLSLAGSASASASSWNLKRYQREDEELWGHSGGGSLATHHADQLARTGHKLMDAIVKAGSSAGRLLDSTLGKERAGSGGLDGSAEMREITNEDRRNFYSPSSFRNPPINDYHPPVVSSRPAHRDGRKWMLQPPPPVKVMEAKVPVSRSTSLASTVSSGRASLGGRAMDTGLGKVVGERLLGAKLRSGGGTGDVGGGENRADAQSPTSTAGPPAPVTPARSRRATVSSSRSRQSQRSRSQGSDSGAEPSSADEGVRTPPRSRRSKRSRPAAAPTTPEPDSEDDDSDWHVAGASHKQTSPEPLSSLADPFDPQQLAAQGHGSYHHPHHHHAARRPGLATILSSESSGKEADTPRIIPPQPLGAVLVGVDPVASAGPDATPAATATTPSAVPKLAQATAPKAVDRKAAAAGGPGQHERPSGRSIDSGLALSV